MLYAHVISSYYCTLGLYACASVYSINSRDQPRRSPCVDYTTMWYCANKSITYAKIYQEAEAR